MEKKIYIVKRISKGAENINTYWIAPEDGKLMDYRPGQFLMLFMIGPHGTPEPTGRPYSIASSPTNRNYIELNIKMLGHFPGRLATLKEGDRIAAMGPMGIHTFEEAQMPEVTLIAGGVGACPLLSMIRYAAEKRLRNKITLFYSARTPADVIHCDELKALAAKDPNFKPIVTLTRCEPTAMSGMACEAGRISPEMLRKHVGNPAAQHYFICGPAAMADAVAAMLEGMNVTPDRIHKEGWG